MDVFTQIVSIVGRVTPNHIEMLGTAFMVSSDGKYVTAKHVIGDNHNGLVILAPHIQKINDFQNVSDTQCQPIEAKVLEIDPIKDLAVLKADIKFTGKAPVISNLNKVSVAEKIGIFGFPHCVDGRRVLTFQEAEIGAKVLLESNKIMSKHAVINIQSRPGQSGSMVFSPKTGEIVGVLIGTYAPKSAGIIVAGINPAELNQTTHVISAEYIKEML
ncbi:MAG: trypsin-like peptidase domain-containing protein [Ectothiorhodospiraceae bacterium]|nr:trypsin-like peptidase domain-containing protein [Ectothiorhodospiraceae bacterium]